MTGRVLHLIYSFRINRISHNYDIPHIMSYAIPQTHSTFTLTDRENSDRFSIRNWIIKKEKTAWG